MKFIKLENVKILNKCLTDYELEFKLFRGGEEKTIIYYIPKEALKVNKNIFMKEDDLAYMIHTYLKPNGYEFKKEVIKMK